MADKKIKLATHDIPKFTGSGDFEDWYRHFDAMMEAWSVKATDRYEALLLVLDADVLLRIIAENKEAKSLPEGDKKDVAWLASELRKRYAYDSTVLKRCSDFLARKKEREETLEGYAVAKRQLFVNWASLMKEDKAVWDDQGKFFWEALLEGLPKSLQPAVKSFNPVEGDRRFDELVKTLRRLQTGEPKPVAASEPKPSGASPKKSPQKTWTKPEEKKTDGVECFYCGKLGHVKLQCPLWKADKASVATEREEGAQGRDARAPQERRR